MTSLDSWGSHRSLKMCVHGCVSEWVFFNGNTVSMQMFTFSLVNKWHSTLINVMTPGSFSCFLWQAENRAECINLTGLVVAAPGARLCIYRCVSVQDCAALLSCSNTLGSLFCVSEQFEYFCVQRHLFPPLQHLHRCPAGCRHCNSLQNDWAGRRASKGFPSPLGSPVLQAEGAHVNNI